MMPDTSHFVNHRQRILDLIRLQKFDRAADEARRALQKDPEDAEVHRLLAWSLQMQNKFAEAELPARTAVRFAPKNSDACSTLGIILTLRGKHEEAKKYHEQAIALAPVVPIYRARYGALLCKTSFEYLALRQADEALSLDPNLVEAHIVRAQALHGMGRLAEAEVSAQRALALNPNMAASYWLLGRVQLSGGQSDAALDSFREAVRLNPSHGPFRRSLVWAAVCKLPVIGVLWRPDFSWMRVIFATVLVLISVCDILLARLLPGAARPLPWSCLVVPLVWGLLFVLAPRVVVFVVMKGWIKTGKK